MATDPIESLTVRCLTADLRMYRHSGIGRYLRNLFPLLLPKLDADRIRVLGRQSILGDAPWLQDPRIEFVEESAPIYSVAEQTMGLRGAYRATDLLWAPHYNAPLIHRGPMVVTMHDVAPLAMPSILGNAVKRAYAKLLIERAVKQADAILCVSEFTATELRERLGIHAGKLTVTHPGLDTNWPHAAPPHTEVDGAPYLLYVGNVKPNKNLGLLLRAFARVMDQLPYRLVLAGKMRGFGTSDEPVIQQATALSNRVRFTDEISDSELISLYAGASALVLPSLYEGFGLPLLEAMQLGCPVLCSTAGSLPEVAGNAALYFDPRSEDELVDKLYEVSNTARIEELRQAGFAQVKQFSFEECARRTAGVMNQLLDRGSK
jgi:glycosyltransferase involved in cell wall biosynthesis